MLKHKASLDPRDPEQPERFGSLFKTVYKFIDFFARTTINGKTLLPVVLETAHRVPSHTHI